MSGDTVAALLFDLGNVVLRIDWQRAFAHWAGSGGGDAAAIAARFSTDAAYARHERGEMDAAAFFTHLDRTLDLRLPHADIEAGWNAVFAGLVPGIVPLLERAAARLPLYVFSNTNATHAATWRRLHADTMALFRGIFLSHEIGGRKPEAAAYLRVAAAIGLPPQRILFFDDLAVNVAAARAVGMRAVQVTDVDDITRALDAVG